ncbi:MAG TPA: UDP-3-O-(3-hydroxymyristoyl)glucosamine N-acyltransferase [Ferruginibacter sp.]|nr:UDP-3-O-(3-hydroxymyristoyl)glucosamine N-acyltransferase [Ferruginibacter sp.]HMP20700.1 UDP-3-O-(3-hydroxymyristoyl)glucosamine N-acyltransferase [Ferruginibacter sp.]
MRFPSPVSLQWIATFINAELIGNTTAVATGINEIHRVEEGDLVFVDHPKYYDKCINSAASFIIINKKADCPDGKALLITDEPFEAYCKLVNHFAPFTPSAKNISDTAVVSESSIIFPGVYIGHNVTIGSNCIIHPHVSIMDNCIIGDNVIIQAGTVIGSDAFYYNGKKNREHWYKKMPSCGRVIIKNDAEIGANCTIDRGVSHDTIIGAGTKLDNLVHIGHDVVVGNNCLFAAAVVVGGCTEIKDGVTLWGQVAINKTLTVGENAVVLAQSGVPASIEGNKTYLGSPAQQASAAKREMVWIKRIPELWAKMKGV